MRGRILFAVLLIVPALRAEEIRSMFSDESLHAIARAVIAETAPRDSPRPARPYWTMAGWLTAATIYDVETTFWLMDRCATCDEQNPLTKGIVEEGRLATYAYSLAIDGVVLYVAKRMFERRDPWWRVIPIALTIVHAAAGTWNLYQSTRPPS